ncbi:MAG TPA: hypothetical protein VGM82_24565 [Gemmatimonadaceae bacterium]|jgi:hypothetical protein
MIFRCQDEEGADWEIYEVGAVTDAGQGIRVALVRGWLCFERNDGHRVRVVKGTYPDDWSKLAPNELLALRAYGEAGHQPRVTGKESPGARPD